MPLSEPANWMNTPPRPPVDLQTDRPHAARVYDVLLGGKTNYAADREAAAKALAALPSAAIAARQNRAFMRRVALYLAAKAGIRQYLDIGTGIPTSPNLHEVVQEAVPSARVVYVDNDPIVLAHSRALHASHPEGRTTYLQADLCDPDRILNDPHLNEVLDLDQPVALSLLAVLHWLPDGIDRHHIVARFMERLAPGSYLTLSYGTGDFEPEPIEEISRTFRASGSHVTVLPKAEIVRFFDGLELIDPGVVVPHRWQPDPGDLETAATADADVPLYGGLARKP